MPTGAHFFRGSREAGHVPAIRAGGLEEVTALKLTWSLPFGHIQPVCICTWHGFFLLGAGPLKQEVGEIEGHV